VMSPILFSLFVNGLAREIKERGKGVPVGDRRLKLLLYADDIVLLAETEEDLQAMLDVVTEYSRKWRFRVNPKQGKSEVMVFGRRVKEKKARTWMLGGEQIEETARYKYLGMDLGKGIQFKALKDRLWKNARKRMMIVWAMGMRSGELPVQDCCSVWKALVRPALEYGAEVWGAVQWEEAEKVQREMAKMILRCSTMMANEVVLGELGWWTMKGRRDLLRLKYWGRIVGMADSRLVKQVYVESRKRQEGGKQSKWCADTKALLEGLGMEGAWARRNWTEEEQKGWNSAVWKAINSKEEQEWKERTMKKPKLRTYRLLKKELCFEAYLTDEDRKARAVMTRLRGGTNELRIEIGRYPITTRDRRLEVHERQCLLCMSGEVEDEKHFVLDCVIYEDLRAKMKTILLKEGICFDEARKTKPGQERLMEATLGNELEKKNKRKNNDAAAEMRKETLNFCRRAMGRRRAIVVQYLDEKT
jgi:hypothetical protein